MSAGARQAQSVIENFASQVEALLDADPAEWRALVERERPGEASSVDVHIQLVFPDRYQVAWLGEYLDRVDEAFRLAIHAAEQGIDPRQIRASRVGPQDGLFLVDVRHASPLKFFARVGDPIDKVATSKPVTYVGALTMALGLVGLEPHVQFGHKPDSETSITQPAPPPQVVNVNKPVFIIVIQVDGQPVHIQCQPPPIPRPKKSR